MKDFTLPEELVVAFEAFGEKVRRCHTYMVGSDCFDLILIPLMLDS